MDPRVRAIYKIEPQPGGPAQARRIIAEELSSRVPPAVLDEIKLMVSELVTNGIVHATQLHEDPVVLDLCVNGEIRCRVLDQGEGFAERTQADTPAAAWRLRVIEQLADRWGMQCSPHRTEVWFERQCG
jgi:anti-sigma regulatory factor (Ser/Thr protein kinase)